MRMGELSQTIMKKMLSFIKNSEEDWASQLTLLCSLIFSSSFNPAMTLKAFVCLPVRRKLILSFLTYPLIKPLVQMGSTAYF